MSEPVFTDEDEQQEYELALLEGYEPEEALLIAATARYNFEAG